MAAAFDIKHENLQGGQDDYSQAFTAGGLVRAPPIRSPLQKLQTANIVAGVVAAVVVLGALWWLHKHHAVRA